MHYWGDRKVHPDILTSEMFVVAAAITYNVVWLHLPKFPEELDCLKDCDVYLKVCIDYDYSKEGSRSDCYYTFIGDCS